jgi:SulP family sulfate permease
VYRDISDAVVAWEDRRLALRTEAPPVTVQAWLSREIGDADMARQLSASLQRVDLAAGEPLFAEGDPADSLYFIASGRLTVTVRTPAGPLEIKVLQAGATAGEMGVYRASTRAATVQATQASQAWRLSRAQLNALEAQSPAMAIALHRLFVRLLADRLDHANAHARALAD